MKLPRGVSVDRVIRALQRLGYEPRQAASRGTPAHAITVPLHNPLKTGTLHGILSEVAEMRSITIESIADSL